MPKRDGKKPPAVLTQSGEELLYSHAFNPHTALGKGQVLATSTGMAPLFPLHLFLASVVAMVLSCLLTPIIYMCVCVHLFSFFTFQE